MYDTLGTRIRLSDKVTVTSYGQGARRMDVGRILPVVGWTARRVRVELEDGRRVTMSPYVLAVTRRDGQPGHEGNR